MLRIIFIFLFVIKQEKVKGERVKWAALIMTYCLFDYRTYKSFARVDVQRDHVNDRVPEDDNLPEVHTARQHVREYDVDAVPVVGKAMTSPCSVSATVARRETTRRGECHGRHIRCIGRQKGRFVGNRDTDETTDHTRRHSCIGYPRVVVRRQSVYPWTSCAHNIVVPSETPHLRDNVKTNRLKQTKSSAETYRCTVRKTAICRPDSNKRCTK